MENTTGRQVRPFWLMLSLAILVIIFGVITICSPHIFRKFMDVILGFFLLFAGISAIINTFKNKNVHSIRFLGIIGFLLALIGFGLIFSWSQVVGTVMIRIFALWALIRGVMLIIFGLNNKDNQSLRWMSLGLGGFLFILALIIICVPKSESRTWAGVCIGISTILDGISLLIMALKIKNNPTLQAQIIDQANQNEISQGDVVVTATSVTISTNEDNQPNNNPENK